MKFKVGDKVRFIGGGIGEELGSMVSEIVTGVAIKKGDICEIRVIDDGHYGIKSGKGLNMVEESELQSLDEAVETKFDLAGHMDNWRIKNHNVFKNPEIFWEKFFEEMNNNINK